MPEYNITAEHSQEKLEVYKHYLISYLSVITKTPHFVNIIIWDVFAGSGVYDDGKKGSALIAAEIINDYQAKTKQALHLVANELNNEKFEKLRDSLKQYPFAHCHNRDVNNLLQNMNLPTKRKGVHQLFFIDPYGYTQLGPANLKQLLSGGNIDYLLFIPVSHIYRFAQETTPKQFLLDLGFDNQEIKSIENRGLDVFVKLIKQKLKEISTSDFIYDYQLKNRQANSTHVLIFITKHILGAHKFLEVKQKLTKQLPTQLELFDMNIKTIEKRLGIFLEQAKTNVELYEWGIKNGFLPNDLNPTLKQWKKEQIIKTNPKNAKGFYIDYRYYQKKNVKVTISK